MSLLQKIEEKRNRQIKKDKNKKIAIATAGVATGAVVGTIAGVLIAPKSGKETIEDVKEKSNQVKWKRDSWNRAITTNRKYWSSWRKYRGLKCT